MYTKRITFLESVGALLLSKLGVVLLTSPTPNRSKTELFVFNSVGGGELLSSSLSGATSLILVAVLGFGATFLVIIFIEFCGT